MGSGESGRPHDVAVLGGGLAGMATALRLQAAGLRTVVLEIHDKPGGCAGFYARGGFSFDVGATTLVDFGPGGVGGRFLAEVGLPPIEGEDLDGYMAWLPDRRLVLHRDPWQWAAERLAVLGGSDRHRRFWATMDAIADALWPAAARGIRMPFRGPGDAWAAARALGPGGWPLARYLGWSLGDLLRRHDLRDDAPLVGLLSMIAEDTLNARSVDDAPLVNAALGASIRGRIMRPAGGMAGLWEPLVARYRALGGELRLKTKVTGLTGTFGAFRVATRRGEVAARQVESSLPLPAFLALAPEGAARRMRRYAEGPYAELGGGVVLCLGVPASEVEGHAHRHHQLLQSYEASLGDGNNMFISVSAPGDRRSAPAGHRAVMISTHSPLGPWQGLDRAAHARRRDEIEAALLGFARRVYPALGTAAQVRETGTPRTYARFARRPDGAVGGIRLSLATANLRGVPHASGIRGLHLAGEYTWPGLGTVACLLGSALVAADVRRDP